MNNKNNQEPDFNDPNWYKKVTDWNDFWNYQKWDMEIEGLDDEHDVGGNPVCSEQRVMRMFAAIKDVRLRGEVMQWMPPALYREHYTQWENSPVLPERQPMNPDFSHNDLRALSEKRQRKAIMDAEWRRRQALIGVLRYPDPYELDVRLDPHAQEVRATYWSPEQWRSLITMDGMGANPEDHLAFVENPLVPVDYVQTVGVYWVEETEDFLESIGHLATAEEEGRFDTEVIIDALDAMGLTESDLLEQAIALEDITEEEMQMLEDDDNDDDYEDEDEDEDGMVEVQDGDGY
ncbi:hypothetical protein FOA52_012539 [Chlamydomonas sp. UWO 241]|nr:hypothetical protein FOA52_012539 [Chlamydomonas sp. UWO 241]